MGGSGALPLPFLLGTLMQHMHGGSSAPAGNMESLLERLRAAYEPPTHPTSKSAIDSLPIVPITVQNVSKQDNCTVCMEEYKENEPNVVQLPCNHLFHKVCLIGWLKDHNVCPVCRYELPEERGDGPGGHNGNGASTVARPSAAAGAGSGSNSMEEDEEENVEDVEDEEGDLIAQALGPMFAPFFGRSPSFGQRRRTRRRTGGSEEGGDGQEGHRAAGGVPGAPFGRRGAGPPFFPRLVRVDAEGFASDELEAALRASMGQGQASAAAASAAALPASRPGPSAPSRMDTGGGGEEEEGEAMAAVLWESLATLTVPQLQEQCVLEGLMDSVPAHMAQNKDYLEDVILRASGADMAAVGRVRLRRRAVPAPAPASSSATSSSSAAASGPPAPAAGYNRPPPPAFAAVRFLDSIRVPSEPPADDDSAYSLRVYLPNGSSVTRRWDEGDTLSQVVCWAVRGLGKEEAEAMGIKQDGQGVPQVRLRWPSMRATGTSQGQGGAAGGGDGTSSGTGSGSGASSTSSFGPDAWDVELRMAGIDARSVVHVEPLP